MSIELLRFAVLEGFLDGIRGMCWLILLIVVLWYGIPLIFWSDEKEG